jgi:hypothetical protein
MCVTSNLVRYPSAERGFQPGHEGSGEIRGRSSPEPPTHKTNQDFRYLQKLVEIYAYRIAELEAPRSITAKLETSLTANRKR